MKRTRISFATFWLAVILGVLAIPSAASTAPISDTPQSTTAITAISFSPTGIATEEPPPAIVQAGQGSFPMPRVPASAVCPPDLQSELFKINFYTAATCPTWPDAARAAFCYAAGRWGALINSTVPINIMACWSNDSKQTSLADTASLQEHDFSGAPITNTLYPMALANALAKKDLNGETAEFIVGFNSGINWYYGFGTPPWNKFDFISLAMHEIGHGLGFGGVMEVDDGDSANGNECNGTKGVGCWEYPFDPGYPSIYDRFTENGSGQAMLSFPNYSTSLAAQLQSNNLYFNGPYAKAANAGNPPKLYAPTMWISGSSYSHLNEDTFNGTDNALMTPRIDEGERGRHSPGPVTLGIMRDLGWPPSTLTVKANVPYGPRTLQLMIYEVGSAQQVFESLPLPLNDQGYATTDIPNLPTRGYDIYYKSSVSIWKKRNELIQPGPNTVDLGTIDQVGDFNNDNCINVLDFSMLRYCIYNPSQRPRCDPPQYDLNRDGAVNVIDFSRWKQYFNLCGEAPPKVAPSALMAQDAPESIAGLGSMWLTPGASAPKPVGSEFTVTLSLSSGDYVLRGLDSIVKYDLCAVQYVSGTSLGTFNGLLFSDDPINGILHVRSSGMNDSQSGTLDVATLRFKAISAAYTTTLRVLDKQATQVDKSNLASTVDDGIDRLGSAQDLSMGIAGSPARPLPNMVLDAPSGGVSRSSPFMSVTVTTSDTCRGSNIKTVWLELFDQGSWKAISQDSDIVDGWGRIVDLSQNPDGVYQLRARVEQQTYSQPSEQIQLVCPIGADKTFILDRTPPSGSTLTVTYAPESGIPAYRIEWGGATDNQSSPKYKVVYLLWGPSSAEYVWQSDVGPGSALFYPAEGQRYTFYVDAIDDAGNSESDLFGEYRGGWNIPWSSIYLPVVMRK